MKSGRNSAITFCSPGRCLLNPPSRQFEFGSQGRIQEQLQAAPYERSESRTDSRNGFRTRDLKTRIGTITLNVPRHRNQPFHTLVFENCSRSETLWLRPWRKWVVSARKVARVAKTLCGTSISKSAVSDVCRDLDKKAEAFRSRPIEGNYPFLTVDAAYFKGRENGRIVSKPLMIAYGTVTMESAGSLVFGHIGTRLQKNRRLFWQHRYQQLYLKANYTQIWT